MPTLNELLHAASRTFAIGIDRLPEPLRSEVEVAYLLLRVSDFLEDNVSMEPERKARLLGLWADVLAGDGRIDDFERELGSIEEESPDALVARRAGQVHAALLSLPRAEARAVLVRHVTDSTQGMARWIRRGPLVGDEADLDDYMHEVAGRVGWLLTELFALGMPEVARQGPEMMELGREFGLGLQTVNVIRGLHADWQRGWIYVPRSFLGDGGALPEDVFGSGDPDPAVAAPVLERLVRKAERHLALAERYILRLPRSARGVRLFCLLPYLFAVRTLALSRGNPRVFLAEVKIARPEVRRIAKASAVWGGSNAWIRWYARRLSRPTSAPADGSPPARGRTA